MNLAILGATGSIGASTLDVVASHPDRYRVFALSAHASADALLELCRIHRPRYAVLAGVVEDRVTCARFAELKVELLFGSGALEQIVTHADCDAVMAAIVGGAGLRSTLAAARAGKRVLLANKEALVMAGPLVMRAARESGAQLLPVDSEHNAVFQCLSDVRAVRRIMLTASGGPFRSIPLDKFDAVTPDQACAHPNWVMGRKISVDSATMMNKGLEVIEARWLFEVPAERIEVLIHPQHRAFAGGIRRRLGHRAAFQSGHAGADRARARASRAHRFRGAAARSRRVKEPLVRAPRSSALPVPAARLRGAARRRHGARGAERGQ
jgi:1-deoxy-D-xylulose-5-phosphate reductoisomerase